MTSKENAVKQAVHSKGGKGMKFLDKVKNKAQVAGRKVNKHAPTILTGAGIVGLGVTAYLAYQSKDKVEKVVEDIEQAREEGYEPDKYKVARDLTNALALPISTGLLSVGLIFTSHQIQKNRIRVLAGTVAASAAENLYYRNKYREEHGDEAYGEFYTPASEQDVTFINEDGEKEIKKAKVKDDISNGLTGMWFDKSEEYTDDNAYNKTYVQAVIERLELIYFQRGYLLMNEALQEFGFSTTRQGAVLGWSQSRISPGFEIVQHKIFNKETGFEEPQLFIVWNQPDSEYDAFDYGEGLDKWR